MKANKVSKKGMIVIRFTKEEVNELMAAVKSGGYANTRDIAKAYSKKLNRSPKNIYQKIRRTLIDNSEQVFLKRSKFFYSEEEIQQLKDAIDSKEYKNSIALAKVYSVKLNKPLGTTYNKVRELSGKRTMATVKKPVKVKETPVAKIEVIEEKVKPLTLPQGMTYQGTAKTVELHADHFRVYF